MSASTELHTTTGERAGIEASITDKGYTFHLYESYSAACNAVMFSFFNLEAGCVRILTDYNNNKMVHMHPPNATHPNGVCVSLPLDPNSNMVAFEGGQLASSARFLGFLDKGGAPAEFQAPAGGVRELVRCVRAMLHSVASSCEPGPSLSLIVVKVVAKGGVTMCAGVCQLTSGCIRSQHATRKTAPISQAASQCTYTSQPLSGTLAAVTVTALCRGLHSRAGGMS